MAAALQQLRALNNELEAKQADTYWVFDSANLGGTVDQVITQATLQIQFLDGELRERVYSPAQFSEGVTGAAAWDLWRELADATGQQLALALGTLSKWSAGETLKRMAYDVRDAARELAGGLSDAVVMLGLLLVVYFVTIGGRR